MANDAQVPAALSLDGLAGDAREAFALASEAGYQGIAFATNHAELTPEVLGESGRRHLRKILETKRLGVEAIRAAAPRTGITDMGTIDRTVENVRKAVALARDLGVGTVAVNLGPVGSGNVNEGAAAGAVRELAEMADRAGIVLAVSGESSAPVEAILKQIAFDRARVNLDSGRLIAGGEDPLKVAEELAGRLGQFTAADAVRAGKAVRGAFLGEGQLPLVELLEILDEIGFRGPTVVDVRDVPDGAAGARHAAEVLRKAWAAVRR
jgi:sugar phosphate isomerase/epimerase